MARTLDTHYFHVVFTLASELRSLALVNRRELFAMLFAAASQTLLALGGDPARLGATLGITAVLYAWTPRPAVLSSPSLHRHRRWPSARRRALEPGARQVHLSREGPLAAVPRQAARRYCRKVWIVEVRRAASPSLRRPIIPHRLPGWTSPRKQSTGAGATGEELPRTS